MGLKKSYIALCTSLLLFSHSVIPFVSAEKIISSDGASGGVSGTGSVEGYVENEIMRIVLPTNNLNFLLDPNGVIKKTDAAALGGVEYVDFGNKEDGFVFFSQTVDGKKYYSSSTDLNFQNKSSFPISVKVGASFTSGDSGIVLKKTAADFNGSSAGIRFSISDGTNTQSAGTTSANYISHSLTGINSEYSYTYSSGEYRFEMIEKPDMIYPSYSVKLSAECDGKASEAWKKVDTSTCRLNVTWNISKSDTAKTNSPYVKDLGISINSKKLSDVYLGIDFNNCTNITLSSLSYQKTGSDPVKLTTASYSLDGNILTIKESAFKKLTAGSYIYTLKFSNGAKDTVRIDVK